MTPLRGIGEIIGGIGKVADDLFTSDKERLDAEIEMQKLNISLDVGQIEVNKAEAANPSVFVAGWRPAIGWVGAVALAYQFVLYPLMVWGWSWMQAKDWVPATQAPPPVLQAEELWVLGSGMLGIAGLRTFDKTKGTQTDRVQRKAAE